MANDLRDHPHMRQLRESAAAYRAGLQKIDTLQACIEAIEMALEGDVPKDIHRAVRWAGAELEYIRFAVAEACERDEVERVLQELEAVLASRAAI